MKFLLTAALGVCLAVGASAQAVFLPGEDTPANTNIGAVAPTAGKSCDKPALEKYVYTNGHTWGCVGKPGSMVWTDLTATASGATLAGAITPSNGTAGLTTNAAGQIMPLQKIDAVWVFGDSYQVGFGVNNWMDSMIGLLRKDTPAPIYDFGMGASQMSDYVTRILNNYDPNPLLPSVAILGGSENDGGYDTCSTTLGNLPTNCTKQFAAEQMAALSYLSIPWADRMMASNCAHTGGFSQGVSISGWINRPTYSYIASPGYNMEPYNASTLTCTISTPTTVTQVGINYGVIVGSSQSFSVTIDGSAATDAISGTTNFSAAPLITFRNAQSASIYRQQFAVSPASTHTIVFSTSGTSNDAVYDSVDWIVPNSAVNNVVFELGQNQSFGAQAAYDFVAQQTIATLQASGLPVNFVNGAAGFSVGGTTYGWNGTSDVSTTASGVCTASTLASHPNTCGHQHYEQAILAEQAIAQNPTGGTGYYFASPNAQANAASFNDLIANGPIRIHGSIGNAAITAAASIALTHGVGVQHVTGTTPITLMSADPLCFSEYTACMATLIFDTAGASVTSGTAANLSYFPFAQNMTVPVAGTAVTFLLDYLGKWYPIQTPNGYSSFTFPSVASAATIAPTTQFFLLTGTTSVTTITAPSGWNATTGGCLDFLSQSAVTFGSGGNITSAGQITTTAGQQYRACYFGSTGWTIK